MPHWARVPMIFLATAATVIASQAVISGAFSVTRQMVRLGYLPRLRIRHTSRHEGQIYVPFVNWTMMAAVLVLVLAFERSENLAVRLRHRSHRHDHDRRRAVLRRAPRAARAPAVVSGGAGGVPGVRRPGVPRRQPDQGPQRRLAAAGVGGVVCLVLFTWQRGRVIVTEKRERVGGPARGLRARAARARLARSSASPAPPCSSTAATRRRRSPCARTSSTTTRCTSTSSCSRSRRCPVPYIEDAESA